MKSDVFNYKTYVKYPGEPILPLDSIISRNFRISDPVERELVDIVAKISYDHVMDATISKTYSQQYELRKLELEKILDERRLASIRQKQIEIAKRDLEIPMSKEVKIEKYDSSTHNHVFINGDNSAQLNVGNVDTKINAEKPVFKKIWKWILGAWSWLGNLFFGSE
jgi:hypothetical protein